MRKEKDMKNQIRKIVALFLSVSTICTAIMPGVVYGAQEIGTESIQQVEDKTDIVAEDESQKVNDTSSEYTTEEWVLPDKNVFQQELVYSQENDKYQYNLQSLEPFNTSQMHIAKVRVLIYGSASNSAKALLEAGYKAEYAGKPTYQIEISKADLDTVFKDVTGQIILEPVVYVEPVIDAEEQETSDYTYRIISEQEQVEEKTQSTYAEQEKNKILLDNCTIDSSWNVKTVDADTNKDINNDGIGQDITSSSANKDESGDMAESEPLFYSFAKAGENQMTMTLSSDQKTVSLQTGVVNSVPEMVRMRFAVWSSTNGQDDLRWYDAVYQDQRYQQSITISDFKHLGEYTVHCYAFSNDGTTAYVDGGHFTVNAPRLDAIKVSDIDKASGSFQISLENLAVESGVTRARVAVWCADNQSDIRWYTATKSNGQYMVNANIANHGLHTGTYKIHTYVTDGNNFTSYTGGTTKVIAAVEDKLYIEDINQDQKEFQAVISGSTIRNTQEVRFAVWSDVGGQDDLRWYTAAYQGGVYSQKIQIAIHKSIGKYQVHAYAFAANGAATYLKGGSFVVDAPKASSVNISETENGFSVNVQDITAPSGITNVEMAVWSASDMSDLRWYNADQIDRVYAAQVVLSNHKDHIGSYKIHTYVTDGNGIKSFCVGTTQQVGYSCEKIAVSGTEHEASHQIVLTGLKSYGLAKSVEFAVWSKENGQDDLKWYKSEKNSTGYQADVDIMSFKSSGEFEVHAYAANAAGEKSYVSGTSFTVNGIMSFTDVTNGKFRVEVFKLSEESTITAVTANVTVDSAAGVQAEFLASKDSTGKYVATIDMAKLNYAFGSYQVQIYTTRSTGGKTHIMDGTKEVRFSSGSISTAMQASSSMKQDVTLKDVNLLGIGSNVRFAVWSDVNGQDDIRWYSTQGDERNYQITIPIGNHKSTGTYRVHAYFDLPNGTSCYLNGLSFEVTTIPTGEVNVYDVNSKAGTFSVEAQVGNLGINVKTLRAGVWCDGSVVWYDMTQGSNGIYTAFVDVKNHEYHFGEYTVHVYAQGLDGSMSFVAGKREVINADNYCYSEELSSDVYRFTIYGANVNGQTVSRVVFPTWTVKNGQDDIVWNEGTLNSRGGYTITINRNNYANSGAYITHVYLYVGTSSSMASAFEYSLYRSGEYDEYAREVMRKIMYAVETGGQIYGNARYNDFTQAYTNSTRETAITIGAGQWFATEAKRLLTLIRSANPNLFAALDTAGIGKDLDTADWSTYGGDGNGGRTILKGSAKAVCIQNIISSETGIQIQDQLVDEQMERYINEAETLGVTDLKGKMFCANVRHLGGYSTMKWVIECCQEDGKPLTMTNLYNSMRDHTSNKAGNGVGADKYDSRHKKVMGWLNEYLD